MYDAYSLLHGTKGQCIGMNSTGEKDLKVLMTGDSACVFSLSSELRLN
jgi:hypothetical protein